VNIYRNTFATLIKFCQTFITNNPGYTGLSYFDFDTAGALNTYPANDVLGLSAFELEEINGQQVATALIGVSTVDDVSYLRLREIADKLYDLLQPEAKILMVNASNGNVIGYLTVMSGTAVYPLAKADNRPGIFVAFRAGLSKTATLSP